MNTAELLIIVVVLLLGTAVWLTTTVAGFVVLLKMPESERKRVPSSVYVAWGAAVLTSVVWPVGVLSSIACAALGGWYSFTGPREIRAFTRLATATGVAYLGVLVSTTALMLLLRPWEG